MEKLAAYKSRIILLGIELFIILLLIPGCFSPEELVYRLQGHDALWQEQQRAGGMTFQPGVYQIRVWTVPGEGQGVTLEAETDFKHSSALKGNSVTVLPQNEYTDFEVYVTDTVPSVYIQCSPHEGGVNAVEDLSVYRLNWGNRILLAAGIVFFLLLDGALLYRRKIIRGDVSAGQQIVFWTLLGGVLLVCFPCFADYLSCGGEALPGVLRIEELKDELSGGRMSPAGGEIFLYIPVLLRLAGFPLMTAYKLFLIMAVSLNAILSYRSIRRCVETPYAVLVGSMVCLLAPYGITNLYGGGGPEEYLAAAFMAPVCCGMYLLLAREDSPDYGKYKWWVGAGMCGVWCCCRMSAGTAAVFMAVGCAVFWKKAFRRATLIQLLEAAGIVLLAGCLFELSGLGGARRHGEGFEPSFLGMGMILAVTAFLSLELHGRNNGIRREHSLLHDGRDEEAPGKKCRIFCACVLLAAFLSVGSFPWDGLETLPAHFMGPGTALGGMFAAFFVLWMRRQKTAVYQAAFGILAAVFIGSALYRVNGIAMNALAVRLYTAENREDPWSTRFIACGDKAEEPDGPKG